MKTDIILPTATIDDTVPVSDNAFMDALIERELQQQDRIRRQLLVFAHRDELLRRRHQTAIVATLVNITSVAALLVLALVWQFYFPIAQAVAAMLP